MVAFVSAFLGAASKIGLDYWTRINESRSTAAMLAAEIDATLSIARQRKYSELTYLLIKKLDNNENIRFVDFINNPESLDLAYRASVSGFKLGLVGPELAGLVTKFFRQLYGLIGDMKRFGDAGTTLSISEKKIYLEESLRIWEEAERDGVQAIAGLRALSRRETFRHFIEDAKRPFRGR